jgi:hypothetical protein
VALPLLVVLAGLQVALTGEDAPEESLEFAQLPPAVQEAVKQAYPEATIRECEKETEDGQTIYEVELQVEGREVDLELDASGKILGSEGEITEEEIALAHLPEAISSALKTLVPNGKPVEAERKIEGKTTTYEVEVLCHQVILELTLNDSGKVLRIDVEDEAENEGEGQDEAEEDDEGESQGEAEEDD